MEKNLLSFFLLFVLVVGAFFVTNLVPSGKAVDITTTVKLSVCGNNVREGGEQCDGNDLAGKNCSSFGFSGGTLSCNAACEFNTSQCRSGGGGGGGGGGGYIPPAPVTSVIFEGRAYPLSKIIVLKDGQIAVSTIAGPDARFEVTLTGLATGNYTFALYGEDNKELRSSLFTFPVYITFGATTKVSGIFIAPTIAVDKSEVKRGDNIAIFGQSVPNSEITIVVNSDEEFFNKIKADVNGIYLYNFDTSPLAMEQHFTKSKAAKDGAISSFSKAVSFLVGTKNITAIPEKTILKGNLNSDNRVNLVDFSIAAYWYKRPLNAAFKTTEIEKLNGDGKVDLIDFSIMAFYWTG